VKLSISASAYIIRTILHPHEVNFSDIKANPAASHSS